jgi:SAM-dependent methyltransferase
MNFETRSPRSDGRGGSQDDLRTHVHGMWAAVAGGWAEHADYADRRGAEIGQRMLELADPRPGERVLELACGPAGLGLSAAQRVLPGGTVVVSDFVAEMTTIAAARAAAIGTVNVEVRLLDVEAIAEPDGSYDVVLCREGLMFATDPARAGAEIARVLRPGGRVAIAVWGPRSRNPWLGLVLDVVSAQVGRPVPPLGLPGPFALEDAERLARLLSDAGLSDVSVREVPAPLHAGSFEEWWTTTAALAGPVSRLLSALPADAQQEVHRRARDAARPYLTAEGFVFPGVSLVASARRR